MRLFATARTTVGRSGLDWPAPPEGVSARALLQALAVKYPGLERIFRGSRYFVDGEPIARLDVRVRPGQEFTVHPPYGGG